MKMSLIAAAAFAAVSCSFASHAQTATAPATATAAAPAPTVAVDVENLTPLTGQWSYRTYAGGSEAAFADNGGVRRLVISCNRVSRTVSIVRSGVPAATATLSIWTSSESRAVPARFEASQTLTADLASSDRLLDAIAFTRGRFATSAVGSPLTAFPGWPESERVIEDCRT